MHTPETVHTKEAPQAIGPYSQAIVIGDFVFTSGQIPIHPEQNTMPEDIREQAVLALKNMRAILEAANSNMNLVVKTTVFLTDMEDFPLVNEIYQEFFTPPYPARSCVGVKELPKNAKIEIEAIARKKQP